MKIKNKKTFILICAVIIAAIIAIVIVLLPKNTKKGKTVLKENFNKDYGSFLGDAYINDGEASLFSFVKDGGPDGSGCLKLENVLPNDSRFITPVKFEKGKIYKFSCDVKVESLSGESPCVGVSVYSLYSSGFKFIENVSDWQKFTIYFKTNESDEFDFCLRLGYFSRDTVGVCYFDNALIETVDKVPEGATLATVTGSGSSNNNNTVTTDAEYNESVYFDMRIVSILVIAFFLIIFLIWYVYVIKSEQNELFERKINLTYTLIGLFIVALIFRLILSLTYYQCEIDVNLFKYWGTTAANKGIGNIYSYCEKVGSVCDYPPVYIYFLSVFAAISGGNSTVYTLLVKILPILSDLFIGAFIAKAALKNKFSEHFVVFLSAIWLFNPMVILDSACWGQVDSFLTVFILMAAYFLTEKKYFFSGLFVGLGIMLKPQMIIFLPVIGSKLIYDFIVDIKNKSYNYVWKGLLGGIIGLFVPAIPYLKMGLADCKVLGLEMKLPWICSLFANTVDSYDYATVNCYNFWFLIGKNWVKDDVKLGPLTIHTWGMIAICVVCLSCLLAFIYLLAKKKDENVNATVYSMTAAVYMIVSCFGPRMHERYFFPALAMMIIAYILTRKKLFVMNYALTSVFGFISVHEIMLGILVGGSIKSTTQDYSAYSDFYWPKLTGYRGILAFFVVAASIFALVNAIVYTVKGDKK